MINHGQLKDIGFNRFRKFERKIEGLDDNISNEGEGE